MPICYQKCISTQETKQSFSFRVIRALIASQSMFENKMMNSSFYFLTFLLLFVSHFSQVEWCIAHGIYIFIRHSYSRFTNHTAIQKRQCMPQSLYLKYFQSWVQRLVRSIHRCSEKWLRDCGTHCTKHCTVNNQVTRQVLQVV